MTVQLWQVTLTDERKGPRGGRAKPVISTYVVAAESLDEARAVFEAERPGYLEHSGHVSIAETQCRTWSVR